jgi:HK97 gp10 family phage protein
MRVEIVGADNLRRVLHEFPRNVRSVSRKAMQLAVGLVHRHAVSIVPVDIGLLKNSLWGNPDYERTENTIVGAVGTNKSYAPFVEFGTRRMRAQPYLIPAVTNNISAINSIFAHEIGNALHG